MVRGPRGHLKRINAPHHWMLHKLGGVWAPRPSPGPHGLRECLPLIILLRNRLKYALSSREVTMILAQRFIKVDGKVRTDPNFPAGFMDVITIEKTNEYFRLLYDTKGRFSIHRITPEEAEYKLSKVKALHTGPKGVPFITTNDGRIIRYPHPSIKTGDTLKIDLKTNKISSFIKFQVGQLVMTTGGRNTGRVGQITNIEKRMACENIIQVKDAKGNQWSTLASNVFIIGEGSSSLVSLPVGKGIKLSILEERVIKLKQRE